MNEWLKRAQLRLASYQSMGWLETACMRVKADWDEGAHPRDETGKFAEGGGDGAGIAANATGGKVRQIGGHNFNTADVVNRALSTGTPDLEGARTALRGMGHKSPPEAMVKDYARQKLVLQNISDITHSNARDQIGKWDFSNASTIHRSFNSYLERRIQGQHARWTARTKGQ